MKKKVFVIDTSAILSGKPVHIDDASLVTTPSVSNEINPGGRDFQTFELLKEIGLAIHIPSKKAIEAVKKVAQQSGDDRRLSATDIEVIALALDINQEHNKEATILSDDYSIQNIASIMQIKYQSFNHKGITKKFKWVSRCPGCGKRFKEITKICPICGTLTRNSPLRKKNL
jgi:UPF0271 protein